MNNIIYDQELANKITPRQKQIIDEMIEGYRNREIADRLGIKLDTVEAHKRNVFKKIGCKSPAQLVAMLFRGGILA